MIDRKLKKCPALLLGVLALATTAALVTAQTPPGRPDTALIDRGDAGPRLGPDRVRPSGATFVDPSSGVVFPESVVVMTRDSWPITMKATGSGVRKKLMFKVYAAALYVDEHAPLGEKPLDTLAFDDLPRRMVLSFRRDADGNRIREAMEEGFETVWKAKPGPELNERLREFLHWFDGGVKNGETIELTYLPGEGLYTVVAGVAHPAVTRPDIARSVWQIWLGPEPVASDLRRDLVRLIARRK